jgi:uncharacterized YigZ family protein
MKDGRSEVAIEKSKFIGRIRETKSREEADHFFNEIRNLHKDATHNVPAFVLGDSMQHKWASDDKEPQGTSGPPILSMLEKEGLTYVAVMVTRYFGGVKLGTGGLARAYTMAAKAAVEDAGVCGVLDAVELRYEFDYSVYEKLRKLAGAKGFELKGEAFLDKISASLVTDISREEELADSMRGITSGRETLIFRKELEQKVSL